MKEIQIQTTKIFFDNYYVDSKYDVVINKGGSGSSKTHSLIQLIIQKGMENPNARILVLRKVRATLSKSVYYQFIEYLKEINLYSEDSEYKSELYYVLPSGTQVHFCGLDDKDKIKSTEWIIIWMEEANEFSYEDYLFLKTRKYRGSKFTNFKSMIYMSFNPEECWIQDFENKPEVKVIHSTYKDNPFVNEEYKRTLEALKEEDSSYYSIYALGQYSARPNLIYKPFIVIPKNEYPANYDETIYGCDFGYNNPSAFYRIGYKDNLRFIEELIYESKLVNKDLINRFNDLKIDPNNNIYCDSAEPQRIEEFCNAGFNALPSDKSRKDGIDFIKSIHKDIRTCPENVFFNKEAAGYSYKKDKKGDLIDEPVKFKDHALDAVRYALYTHEKNRQPTLRFV
jgi:phage terminase large subunit